eukprot:9438471-Alexandrium_andersonii.AAC.1
MHHAFIRRIIGAPTTWGSMQMQRPPINNEKIGRSYGGFTIESRIKSMQLLALGHVWRRDMHSPVLNLAMDRFFKPR